MSTTQATPIGTRPRDDGKRGGRPPHPPLPTAREREQDARRGYQTAVAAARDLLRRAEARFEESSAAIDTHTQRAREAAGERGIGCPVQATATSGTPQAGAATTRALPRRPTLSPVPSTSSP